MAKQSQVLTLAVANQSLALLLKPKDPTFS